MTAAASGIPIVRRARPRSVLAASSLPMLVETAASSSSSSCAAVLAAEPGAGGDETPVPAAVAPVPALASLLLFLRPALATAATQFRRQRDGASASREEGPGGSGTRSKPCTFRRWLKQRHLPGYNRAFLPRPFSPHVQETRPSTIAPPRPRGTKSIEQDNASQRPNKKQS